LHYFLVETALLVLGGVTVAVVGALLDRRRARRYWHGTDALVLFFPAGLRLLVGAATLVLGFAFVVLATNEPDNASDCVHPAALVSFAAMALLGAGTWLGVGRKVVVDPHGVRHVPRLGRAGWLAWDDIERCRWSSGDLLLVGGGRRFRASHRMLGFAVLGAWCARHLPAGVYERDVAQGHRAGWFAPGPVHAGQRSPGSG